MRASKRNRNRRPEEKAKERYWATVSNHVKLMVTLPPAVYQITTESLPERIVLRDYTDIQRAVGGHFETYRCKIDGNMHIMHVYANARIDGRHHRVNKTATKFFGEEILGTVVLEVKKPITIQFIQNVIAPDLPQHGQAYIDRMFELMPNAKNGRLTEDAELHVTGDLRPDYDVTGIRATVEVLKKYGKHVTAYSLDALSWIGPHAYSLLVKFENDDIGTQAVMMWNKLANEEDEEDIAA